MARGRALLTEYERESLAGEHTDQRRYEARSRFRSRVTENLTEDIEFLEKNDPELLGELREVVCQDADGETPSRERRESREEPPEQDEVVDTASDSGRREPATAPTDEAGRDSAGLEDALAALDTTDRRRDAVRACVAYLREAGTASKSDFQREVYPDHPAGLQSEGGWWNKIGLELLKAVAADSSTILPPDEEGAHTWEYAGDDR